MEWRAVIACFRFMVRFDPNGINREIQHFLLVQIAIYIHFWWPYDNYNSTGYYSPPFPPHLIFRIIILKCIDLSTIHAYRFFWHIDLEEMPGIIRWLNLYFINYYKNRMQFIIWFWMFFTIYICPPFSLIEFNQKAVKVRILAKQTQRFSISIFRR